MIERARGKMKNSYLLPCPSNSQPQETDKPGPKLIRFHMPAGPLSLLNVCFRLRLRLRFHEFDRHVFDQGLHQIFRSALACRLNLCPLRHQEALLLLLLTRTLLVIVDDLEAKNDDTFAQDDRSLPHAFLLGSFALSQFRKVFASWNLGLLAERGERSQELLRLADFLQQCTSPTYDHYKPRVIYYWSYTGPPVHLSKFKFKRL